MNRHLTYVAILGVVLAASARAADYSWQVGSGDWSIASNWGGTGPNFNPDNAYVVNGGTVNVTSSGAICYNLTLGTTAGAGTLEMPGGSLQAAYEYIGYSGTGAFLQSGGTNSSFAVFAVGNNRGSYGEYDLSGNALLSGRQEAINNGVFAQSGGTNSLLNNNDLAVGVSGSASYTMTGGFLSVGGDLTLGDQTGGSGTFSLSGIARVLAHDEGIGNLGTGIFTQSGGINSCTSFLMNGERNSSIYNLDGGLLTVSSLMQLSSYAQFNFNGGTLQAGASFSTGLFMTLGTSSGGATIDTQSFSVTQSGLLSGSGGLAKVGSGTLSLTGSNTYTGPTTIEQGLLVVNGPFASAITVESGGALSGTGSLTSVTVNTGGQLAPGGAPGVLQLSGSLSLLPGAALDYELGAPATSDLILMPSGALTLTGQQFADFTFTPLSGFAPGEYMLIDAGSISGGLGANVGGTIDGLPATLAIQGNDVVLHVVPEPSTLALLVAGAIGRLGFRLLGLRWPKRPHAYSHAAGSEPLESRLSSL